jgi:hypothetical protein
MIALACLVVAGTTGCSNKGIDLNVDKTVAFDKSRDPEPVAVGGPTGKVGGPAMTGKGKFGAAAPGTTTPPSTTPPK